MRFKGIFFLKLWLPFCPAERNYLGNFGRGCYAKQLCEIIFNLGQWFRRRCRLNDFLSGALVDLQFGRANSFMQFLKKALWGYSCEVI